MNAVQPYFLRMLCMKGQTSLNNAEQYFREHLSTGDYYSENRCALGEWFGTGAEKLNLKGAVQLGDFVKLCENTNPNTGRILTQRLKSTRIESNIDGETHKVANRRVFYDFTLSPPKSVSIAALVGGDARIEESHHRAATIAMTELEKFAATRVCKDSACTHRTTGNVVGAMFRHDTSRALDPHLHCHCIVFNATHDPHENRWKALETYEMLQAAKYVENVYYHELARDLRRFGYEIDNNRRGDFELRGISAELIERFSKRHEQIDANTAELLEHHPHKRVGNISEIREHIAHNRRARKIKGVARETLDRLWERQLQSSEKSTLAGLTQSSLGSGGPTITTEGAVAWSEEHLFDRRSVVREHEIWRFALEHGRGGDFKLEDIRRLTEGRGYLRNDLPSDKVTTQTALEREWDIVRRCKDGVGRYDRLNGKHVIQNQALDSEQRRAVDQILRCRDFVILFRGGAGTGKSYALKEVRAGLLAAGHQIQVLAPQRQQVIDLERSGLSGGQTVSEFLTRKRMLPATVLVVDEAGQIGAKQLQELLEFVSHNGGRIILSGDTRQHGPVEASDALRAIEKYSGLRPAVLTEIRRQDPALGKTNTERRFILEYKRAVDEARQGKLKNSFDRLAATGAVVECDFASQQCELANNYLKVAGEKQSAVVVSQTWSEIHKVNDQIRSGLKAQNLIGSEDTLVTALQQTDLTDAQKRDKRYYTNDSVLVFNADAGGFKKRDRGKLVEIGDEYVFVEVANRIKPIAFKRLDRISVCEPVKLALAAGDRLQLKANARTLRGEQIANGELVTVSKIEPDGRIRLEDGRILESNYRQFVRGYAVTSYGAQGKTADYVLFSDSAIKAATNQKQW
jgi:conjugative relaxase-like TrwC/TraI family protein